MDANTALQDTNVRAAISQRCGVSTQAISNWLSRQIPAEHCPDIEELTGIRCEVLRPDINWQILRAKVAHTPNVRSKRAIANT